MSSLFLLIKNHVSSCSKVLQKFLYHFQGPDWINPFSVLNFFKRIYYYYCCCCCMYTRTCAHRYVMAYVWTTDLGEVVFSVPPWVPGIILAWQVILSSELFYWPQVYFFPITPMNIALSNPVKWGKLLPKVMPALSLWSPRCCCSWKPQLINRKRPWWDTWASSLEPIFTCCLGLGNTCLRRAE